MNREEDFRNLVRKLLADGIYPSPSAINKERQKTGKWNTLGSDHTRWRREELEAAGWRRFDTTKKTLKHPRPMEGHYFHPNFRLIKGCIQPYERD